jgi:hypothetical protein
MTTIHARPIHAMHQPDASSLQFPAAPDVLMTANAPMEMHALLTNA